MKLYKIMQSISAITATALLILIGVHSTHGQWMQLFDDTAFDHQFQTLSPQLSSVADYPQVPKKKSTIPIIVMLKPKRGKSLTADLTTDANIVTNLERQDDSVSQNNFNLNQLLQRFPGFMDANTGADNQPLIDTYETRQTASILPMPANYIPQQQNLMLQQIPEREETVHWPTSDFEKQLNDKTISSIDSLLPQFAAISESNQKQQMSGNFGQNIDGIQSFEDAIKKFASNLTNLEHSSSDSRLEDRVKAVNANQNSGDTNDETPSLLQPPTTATTHSAQNSGKSSAYLSNTEQTTVTAEENEQNDADNDDMDELTQTPREEDVEQQYNQEVVEELVHKPQPLTSNRQRIKAPVIKQNAVINNGNNDRQIFKGFQPLTGNNDGNEWVPMKSKKSKKRPIRQQLQQQQQQLPQPQKLQQQQQQYEQNQQQLEKPQTMLTMDDLHKNHLFGLPQLPMHQQQHQQHQHYQQHQLQQPFPGIIRPQKFYAAYAPMLSHYQSSASQKPVPNIFKAAASSAQKFNSMNGIRGGGNRGAAANGFHHYPSPYFSALEMQGNANKPQHTEPSKDEDEDDEMEQNDKHHRHHHDMDEEKEDMKGEKDDHKMMTDHRHHHKDMITDDKKEMGAPVLDPNELLTQHLSCCHQLLGQHSPPQHQLHEIGGTPIEEDKYIHSLVDEVHPHHHLHHHLNRHNHHQFRSHPHIKLSGGHEQPCHDEVLLPTHSQHTQYYIPNFPPLPPKPALPPPITRLHFKPNFSFYQKPPLLWG